MNLSNRVVALWLAAILFIVPLFTPSASAEKIKLKDGTVIDGPLVSEDDRQVTIEVKTAGGTITSKRSYPKADIAEIVRPTAEQKAQSEMQAAYEAARKNQLDPNYSLPLAQYDKVLNEIFTPFLEKYPKSPQATEILALKEAWQKEREQVAAGNGKARGQWMSAAEAAALIAQDNAQRFLQQGRALLAQGKTDQAIRQFWNAASTSRDAATVNEANALQSQAYQQWLSSLETEKRSAEHKLPYAESKYKNAESSLKYAEKSLNDYRQSSSKYGTKSSQDSTLDSYKKSVEREKAEFSQAQTEVTTLRNQLANLDRQIVDLKTRLAAVPGATVVAQSAPTSAAETRVASDKPMPVAPTAVAASDSPRSVANSGETREPSRLPPPMVAAMPRPDELESVLNSKVTMRSTDPASVGPKYSPVRLLAVILKGDGTPLMAIGLLVIGAAGIWLIVLAFKENAIWGICFLCVPFVSFVFAVVHWAEAKWAFLLSVVGWGMILYGAHLMK